MYEKEHTRPERYSLENESAAQNTNDVSVTNLPCLSEICHFCYFHDKSQTNLTF